MPSLPHRDSPELHLVLATAEEQLAQLHVNSEEWRGILSVPAYFRREEHLLQQALTRDGGLTSWVLVHQPNGSSERDRKVLCGCESILKRALVASDGEIEDVVAHGVASVFCPPEYRGKGYAGRMMAELGERLKSWQAQGQSNLFSILYSDIGKVRLFLITFVPFFCSSPYRTSTPREDGSRSLRRTSLSTQMPLHLAIFPLCSFPRPPTWTLCASPMRNL